MPVSSSSRLSKLRRIFCTGAAGTVVAQQHQAAIEAMSASEFGTLG